MPATATDQKAPSAHFELGPLASYSAHLALVALLQHVVAPRLVPELGERRDDFLGAGKAPSGPDRLGKMPDSSRLESGKVNFCLGR
jgi:hypothetical protein